MLRLRRTRKPVTPDDPTVPLKTVRARMLGAQAIAGARKARRELLLLIPAIAAVILLDIFRHELFGVSVPLRIIAVLLLVVLGWELARALGRAMAPALFQRLEPGTAGIVGFAIRLVALGAIVGFALYLLGISTETLAVGGAVSAVILGLAAQNTLGNLIAGVVLLTSRPFRVGERIRLQAGLLAGQLEGEVVALGLLHTTLARGRDPILVPNSTVLGSAVVPLREPAHVDFTARLRRDVKLGALQSLLDERVGVPTQTGPTIDLTELDGDQIVVRIGASPVQDEQGPALADEILAAVGEVTRGSGLLEPTGEERGDVFAVPSTAPRSGGPTAQRLPGEAVEVEPGGDALLRSEVVVDRE